MTTTINDRPSGSASDAYIAAVAHALARVPEADRRELLDDLAEHLAELTQESGAALDELLGPPDQYARELVASAGIEPGAREPNGFVSRLRALLAMRDLPAVRRVRAWLLPYRPGWWVARGWLVVAAFAAGSGRQNATAIPHINRNEGLNLVFLVVAIAASIFIARRGPKWLTVLATIGAVVALVPVLNVDRTNRGNYGAISFADSSQYPVKPENIFPFDTSGEPITDVFLFDQDGNPIDVGNTDTLRIFQVPFIPGLFPQPDVADVNNGIPRTTEAKPPHVVIPHLPSTPKTSKAKPKTEPTTP